MKKPSRGYNFVNVIALIGILSLLSACGGDGENPESKFANLANAGALSTATSKSSSSAASSSTVIVKSSSGVVSSPGSSSGSIRSSANSSKSSSSISSSSSLTNIKDSTAPTAPVSLKQANLLNKSVTISWAAATDNNAVTSYRIFRNQVQVAQVSGSTLSFTDANLQPDTIYSYTVQAGDAQGNWSTVSNTLKLKTLTVSGDVTIEWFAPAARENGEYLEINEIGGYEIRYKLSSQAQYTSVVVKNGGADQYHLGYLAGDYEFQIATFDVNGLYSEFVAITLN